MAMKTYCTTYEVVSLDSAKYGDVDERGFLVDGHDCPLSPELCGDAFLAWHRENNPDVEVTADDWTDPDDPQACVRYMADVIIRKGAMNTSGVPFAPGDWYETEPEQDMRTGSYRSECVHLDGWTAEEETAVNKLVRAGKASATI